MTKISLPPKVEIAPPAEKSINQINYLQVLGTNFKFNFFNTTPLEAKDLNKRFPTKLDAKSADFEMDFYNIKDNKRYLGRFEDLMKEEDNIAVDQKGFVKSDFATCIYEEEGKKVSCFYKETQRLSSLVISVIKSTFYFSQRKLNILFLHSAGISISSSGHIFIAPSQGGKTTISDLARKANLNVLSDELLLIKDNKKGFYLYQFPLEHYFDKEMRFVSKNKGYKLENIFFLKKSRIFSLKELSLVQGLARGYPQSTTFFIDLIPDSQLRLHREYVMHFLEKLFRKTSPQELSFNKSDSVFDMLSLKS